MKTYTTADVCELADAITREICDRQGLELDITGDEDDDEPQYTDEAQSIFDGCRDTIELYLSIHGYTNENEA